MASSQAANFTLVSRTNKLKALGFQNERNVPAQRERLQAYVYWNRSSADTYAESGEASGKWASERERLNE
jgi:hypothetical protein